MLTPAGRELVDWGSQEAANSAYLLNAMDGDGEPEDDPTEEKRSCAIRACRKNSRCSGRT